MRRSMISSDRRKRLDVIRSMPQPIPPNDRFRYSVKDVKVGGFIWIKDKVFSIAEQYRYKDNGDEWVEFKLYSCNDGKTLYLEWEEDDELTVSLTSEIIKFKDLNIDEDDLEEMDEEEEGKIKFRGKTYSYEDSYKATFHRGDSAKGDELYIYEFEDEDGKFLTIEEWEGDDYEAFTGSTIPPGEIEVLALGG